MCPGRVARAACTPATNHVHAPDHASQHKSGDAGYPTAQQRTEQQWLPDLGDLLSQPSERRHELVNDDFPIEKPRSQLVRKEEDRRDSDRVGDPDQGDGQRQIAPRNDGNTSGNEHLARYRKERTEQPGKHRPGNRTAVQMPDLGIL